MVSFSIPKGFLPYCCRINENGVPAHKSQHACVQSRNRRRNAYSFAFSFFSTNTLRCIMEDAIGRSLRRRKARSEILGNKHHGFALTTVLQVPR